MTSNVAIVQNLAITERIKSLIRYEASSGLFFWIASRGHVKAGSIAGTPDKKGYTQIQIDHRLYKAHRLVWLYETGEWPVGDIDHRDGCTSNNQFENLRLASRSQNNANRKLSAGTIAGLKGVTLCNKTRKWMAQIKYDRRQLFLGYFQSKEAAHAAYTIEAKRLFGEFARAQ